MSEFLQVTTATPTQTAAEDIARGAIERRLAAGAQVSGPVTSFFWHAGASGSGQEWTVRLTTTDERYPALEAFLLEQHPWDNPELNAVALVAGSSACLDWIRRSTTEAAD